MPSAEKPIWRCAFEAWQAQAATGNALAPTLDLPESASRIHSVGLAYHGSSSEHVGENETIVQYDTVCLFVCLLLCFSNQIFTRLFTGCHALFWKQNLESIFLQNLPELVCKNISFKKLNQVHRYVKMIMLAWTLVDMACHHVSLFRSPTSLSFSSLIQKSTGIQEF